MATGMMKAFIEVIAASRMDMSKLIVRVGLQNQSLRILEPIKQVILKVVMMLVAILKV